MGELVGPIRWVRFHDGQKLRADLPRNSLDPRYIACGNHRFACDCREAEIAEQMHEDRWELDNARKVFNEILAGHATFATADGEVTCQCPGCQIARRTWFRRSWDVLNERRGGGEVAW